MKISIEHSTTCDSRTNLNYMKLIVLHLLGSNLHHTSVSVSWPDKAVKKSILHLAMSVPLSARSPQANQIKISFLKS